LTSASYSYIEVNIMPNEMPKLYDPKQVEKKWYELWERSGYFHAAPNPEKQPYTIVIPPPNITGRLHMGHALDNTIQDAIIRFKRMKGYETLWLPGTDHASIATEVKIIEEMTKEGLSKNDIGREAFLERAWAWRNEYGIQIVRQLRYLGSSCDWERERFTMDEGCNRAVLKVFKQLYDKGLIYRGERIINWCPDCKTTLSDVEVEFEPKKGHLWQVRYDAPDGSYSITVATTRPETILGDTGVAVHPEDPRYQHLVGKTVLVPETGREVPIVADSYCEMDFGTGAVKVTPAHDPNDFEIGERCGLPGLRVFTDDGKVNDLGGKYAGLDRYDCRKAIVENLKASGHLVDVKDHDHNVGTCYRCHNTIETMVSKQWFVSMKPLAAPALAAVKSGEIRFVPERFAKTYYNWMENIRDWCISRQLWWGHRIPAYYCDDCGQMLVEETPPARCPCGGVLRQDEDVLDTWFSSGLWPFSTLGWPDQTEELKYFYPTSTLVTGYDIIFFWVARMIVFGLEVMGERPFDTVYVHGLVRDALGRKMSKSLGNGIDPLELIETYGADSLRFSLVTGNASGADMRFFNEKVEAARNFCNKLYNAARFLRMSLATHPTQHAGRTLDAGRGPREGEACEIDVSMLTLPDKWILSRLNEVIAEVTQKLNAFDLNHAAQRIYDFIWSEFCDWSIELAKPALYGDNAAEKDNTLAVLVHVFGASMKLLHPFMPFITEELYQAMPGAEETVMRAAWPEPEPRFGFAAEAGEMEKLMELIRACRNKRAEHKVPPAQKIELHVVTANAEAFAALHTHIARLAGASVVTVAAAYANAKPNDVHLVCEGIEAYVPLSSLVDPAQERARMEKEIKRLQGEIECAQAKLANEGFLAKAPAHVVEEERAKLTSLQAMLEKVELRVASLA